jgi:RNA polymerase sigma-70 factor (ECF subfamily)
MNEVEDAQLLERSRRGEESAFSELYQRYQAGIYRYAVHMCGAGAGDDVVQETFLAVLRQRGRTDAPRQTVAGYLFGIARHVVLQRLGSKYAPLKNSGDDDVSEVASGALTALDNLTRAETIAAVRAAIHSLPPVYREAVVLCDLQEMEYAAAAGVLQCPIGTVRSRLSRARALLVTKLAAVHSTADARRQ